MSYLSLSSVPMRLRIIVVSLALILSASSANAADAIKIATLRVGASGPLFIAQERGYFAKENLAAEFLFMDQPLVMGQAILAGDCDVGLVGLTAAFFNIAGQGALRILAANNDEAPGYQGLAAVASNQASAAGLTSVKDLAGHSFAITGPGTPPQYALAAIGRKYGFDSQTLRLVPMGTIPNIISAVVGGTADATIGAGTLLKPPIANKQVQLLAWVGDEARFLVTGVVASAATANTKPDIVNRFLKVYREGLADYHAAFIGEDGKRQDGPTAQQSFEIIAKYTAIPAEIVKLGVAHIDVAGRVDVANVMDQIAWYKLQGMVKPEVDGSKIIDMRYTVPLQ